MKTTVYQNQNEIPSFFLLYTHKQEMETVGLQLKFWWPHGSEVLGLALVQGVTSIRSSENQTTIQLYKYKNTVCSTFYKNYDRSAVKPAEHFLFLFSVNQLNISSPIEHQNYISLCIKK